MNREIKQGKRKKNKRQQQKKKMSKGNCWKSKNQTQITGNQNMEFPNHAGVILFCSSSYGHPPQTPKEEISLVEGQTHPQWGTQCVKELASLEGFVYSEKFLGIKLAE